MSQAGRLGTGTPVPPGSAIQTLTGNTGAAVGPDGLGNVDVLGSSVITTNGAPLLNTLTIGFTSATDGQLIIGSSVGAPAWANLTSMDGSVVITNGHNSINLAAPTGGANLFVEDVGHAAPLAGVINVAGGVNINTVGDNAHTITINLNDDISVHNLTVTNNVTFSAFGFGALISGVGGAINPTNGLDGEILIASTAGGAPTWNNITSFDGSIVITNGPHSIDLSAASSHYFVEKVSADVGAPAIPNIDNEIEIVGGSNINTSANGPLGNTITVNLNDNVIIPGTLTVNTLSPGVVQTGGFALFSNKGKDGQVLISATAGVPEWENIISAGGTIAVTNGANYISLDVAAAVALYFGADAGAPAVPIGNTIKILGGSNINTSANGPAGNIVTVNLNDNVIIPGTLTVNTLSPGVVQTGGFALFSNKGTDGQVLISATAGVPQWQNITAGANVAIANGPNSITISSTGGIAGGNAFLAYQAVQILSGAVPNMGPINYPLGSGFGAPGILTTLFSDASFFPGDGAGTPASFTAPATGIYQFFMNVQGIIIGSINTSMLSTIVTPVFSYANIPVPAVNATTLSSVALTINLTIGDTVTFNVRFVSSGGVTLQYGIRGVSVTTQQTYISGYRIA